MSAKLIPATFPKVTVEYYSHGPRGENAFAFADGNWWKLIFTESTFCYGKMPWLNEATGKVYFEKIYGDERVLTDLIRIERMDVPENVHRYNVVHTTVWPGATIEDVINESFY